jgi:hypothetical protein
VVPVIVNGTAVNSAANATANTVVTANADCTGANSRVLGGGGRVTTSNGSNVARVTLQSSQPFDQDTWRVTGVVLSTLTGGQTMTVQAYAICTS